MRGRHILSLTLCMALAAWLGAARCASATPERAHVTIAVGGKSLIAYLPVTLAQTLNLFAKHGLTVDIVDIAGGSKALEALVGGSADFAAGAYENAIVLQHRRRTVTTISLLNNSLDVVIGLTRARAANYRSPKDLKDLKFGVTAPGSASSLALTILLAKDGLTPDQISLIGIGGGAGAIAAMKSGQLDGISNFDPVITRLTDAGDIVPIVDTRTEAGLKYLYEGLYAGTSILALPDMLDRNPQTVQAFVDAIVGALHWMDAASLDEIMAQVPPEYYGADADLYKRALANIKKSFSRDALVPLPAAENILRLISTYDSDMKNVKIDLAKTYDNRFAETAGGHR